MPYKSKTFFKAIQVQIIFIVSIYPNASQIFQYLHCGYTLYTTT